MTLQHLLAVLAGWQDRPGPLHHRLAEAMRASAEAGVLVTGAALPSERVLAAGLGVSRTTVATAYQRLADGGWLVLRRGAVPRVGVASGAAASDPSPRDPLAPLFGDGVSAGTDLTISSPSAAPAVRDLLAHPATLLPGMPELLAGAGYHPAGHPDLLRAVARTLQRDGIDAHPDQILITNGAQQALSLTARALHRPRRPVAIEALSYPGILDVVGSRPGGSVVALPVDPTGLDAHAAARLIAATAPSAVYLTSFQNPTGAALDPRTAEVLLDAATAVGSVIVEDRTLADLTLEQPAAPPLAALRPDATVVTIGSLSKLYWGGLRIGWIHTNPTLTAHLRGRRRAQDLGGSAPLHLLAATLLDEHHDGTRRWRSAALRQSLGALTRAIDDADVGWRYTRPAGGPNLYVQLPHPSARSFVARAARDGIPVLASGAFVRHSQGGDDAIRIPFFRPADELISAVGALGATWRRHLRSRTSAP